MYVLEGENKGFCGFWAILFVEIYFLYRGKIDLLVVFLIPMSTKKVASKLLKKSLKSIRFKTIFERSSLNENKVLFTKPLFRYQRE